MYDNEITLIAYDGYTKDADDNQIPAEVRRTTILCDELAVWASEFYSAAQVNKKPSLRVKVHRFEYDGETDVEYANMPYTVIRADSTSPEEIELICERKRGGKGWEQRT